MRRLTFEVAYSRQRDSLHHLSLQLGQHSGLWNFNLF